MKKMLIGACITSVFVTCIVTSQLPFTDMEKIRIGLVTLAIHSFSFLCAYAYGWEQSIDREGATRIVHKIIDEATKKVIINEYDSDDSRIHSNEYEFDQRFISRFKKVIAS